MAVTLSEQVSSGVVSVILGSKSPRRSELLRRIISEFKVEHANCEELYPSDLKGGEIALYLSKLKSSSFSELKSNELLITADTIVWMKGQVYEKPESKSAAMEMLSVLSGNLHNVYTAVTIKLGSWSHSFVSDTEVKFEDFTADSISQYVNEYNPLDKAGAYGIQDCLTEDGATFGPLQMSIVKGSYLNVIGLPVEQLEHELAKVPLP